MIFIVYFYILKVSFNLHLSATTKLIDFIEDYLYMEILNENSLARWCFYSVKF